MPDNMNYNTNSQPLGYGDPMDPYGQYQQGYAGGMPSPQDLYGQQYMDPNQMYADPNQMYGQPMQQDPYNPYGMQGGYMEPDAGMGGMPGMPGMQGGYMDMDPSVSGQMPYADPYAQQAYPGAAGAGYGHMPAAQPMPMGAQQMPMGGQQMPAGAPAAAPMPDAKTAKEQKRAAKQAMSMGPAPSDGKATTCMFLGILSVVLALFPPIGIILAIIARKMGASYLRAGGRSSRAETGRIFATVGLIFGCIMLVTLILMSVIIMSGLHGEALARRWAVFYNNSPFGNIFSFPIPNPLGSNG